VKPLTPLIDGHTVFIAHIGFPTHSFKAPLIYNPYFADAGINAVVVPMACEPPQFESLIKALLPLPNCKGALITMPHKVTALALADTASPVASVAGACNALRRGTDGELVADMFDGAGFVLGLKGKRFDPAGKRALVVGSGGVGSAIAASLADAGIAEVGVFDVNTVAANALTQRLQTHYPQLRALSTSPDPSGYDLVVNATPLGMKADDALPFDTDKLTPNTFVGEVVMSQAETPLLAAARAKGCPVQLGVDMLFEQIPAYLEFFGFPTTSATNLRSLAHIKYN
jgi:shikimate dehydrogenase